MAEDRSDLLRAHRAYPTDESARNLASLEADIAGLEGRLSWATCAKLPEPAKGRRKRPTLHGTRAGDAKGAAAVATPWLHVELTPSRDG